MMKLDRFAFILVLLISGCTNKTNPDAPTLDNKIAIANQFIDAFYSFNDDSLRSSLWNAKDSQPNLMYYQKWAECGNYKVLERFPCREKNDSLVVCPVLVKDDLMSALELDLNVTDTFHITVKDKRIRSVFTSSNDPDIYYEAKEWINKNRSELIKDPCQDAWAGGPTPCECIKAVIQGLVEFKSSTQQEE
ncbi:MAG TPA: hypothetical protein PKN99_13985 [Cyclobacteriaceae bacterium]|nr:hypothetical protein [Cyclobacteriaceae bacterium]